MRTNFDVMKFGISTRIDKLNPIKNENWKLNSMVIKKILVPTSSLVSYFQMHTILRDKVMIIDKVKYTSD